MICDTNWNLSDEYWPHLSMFFWKKVGKFRKQESSNRLLSCLVLWNWFNDYAWGIVGYSEFKVERRKTQSAKAYNEISA